MNRNFMYICNRFCVYIKSGAILLVQETKEEGEIMGLRFRKSIKIAPGVKLNLNKNSSSVTVGTKGKHYTVNSKGKTTKSVGIPGTGLSYSTTSSSGKTKKSSKKTKGSTVKESSGKQSKPKKKGGCLTSCLVLFVALILFFALIPSSDKKEDNKNPLGFDVDFSSSYRNDVTGRWRLARIAENKPIEEYVLDYYHNYFESDDEVHIIINFTLNTTNRILVFGNLLDVATMEYVDKEEHDAKIACSGMLLSEYLINIDTGEIEEIQPSTDGEPALENIEDEDPGSDITGIDTSEINTEQAEAERIAAEQAEAERVAQEQNPENNFNTYDNPEQQQTTSSYVLNTSTMKFHSPACSDVKKIAPHNYSTFDGTRDDIISQGYSPCGRCNP